ncbi:MAG: hypothetical protein AAF500_06010 [Myxococcota bacterium]
MKRITTWAACLAVALAGCGDSGSADPRPSPPSGLDEVFVASQRVFTPDGRFVLAHVLTDLGPQELEVDTGFEFPGVSRVQAFNGKVFIFQSETGQVIRYRVTDDLGIEEEARFSMANQGITSFTDTNTFVSPTRSFYFDGSGQMVVFDPEAMEIVTTIVGPDVTREGFTRPGFSQPVQVGDELYVSLAWQNFDAVSLIPTLTVAVFSISEERLLRVIEDERCGFGFRGFAHDGAFYVVGDQRDGIGNILFDLPPACLVRIREGEDQFDPDFYVDLTQTAGRPFLANGPVGVGSGRFLNMVYDSPTDPAEFIPSDPTNAEEVVDVLTPFELGEIWRWAVFTLPDAEMTLLEGTPLTGTNPFDAFVVDGVPYVPILDGNAASSQVFRVDSFEDGTTTLTLESNIGEILTVERVF